MLPVVTVSQPVGACGRGSFGAGVRSVWGGHVGQVTSHVRGSGLLVSHKLARAGLWLSLLGLLARRVCAEELLIMAADSAGRTA